MKITYTAPNRSHHYPYAEALNRAGHLYAFLSSFSRFSPRSPLPVLGNKLKRRDFYKNFYIASLKLNAPHFLASKLDRLAGLYLDKSSYRFAKASDVFIFYRTEGLKTTLRLHKEKSKTLCIMEEVNSHVEMFDDILRKEFDDLGLKKKYKMVHDHYLRIEGYQTADCILCPSEFVRKSFISKGFSPDQLIKVNFGFPTVNPSFINTNKLDENVFRILYVGQIHYRKGLRYALEAFRKLKHSNKEFIIVGPKTPITGLERSTIPPGVIFTGALKGEQLLEQFKKASLFILPSLEEGLALVQGEALSMGLPLLITTNTGGEDLITDGVEGFIVPPANIDLLADKLQLLADDKVLLRDMSNAALRTAKTLGSWDIAVENLLNEITRIHKLI